MKVKEIINELKKLDGEKEVYTIDFSGTDFCGSPLYKISEFSLNLIEANKYEWFPNTDELVLESLKPNEIDKDSYIF